MLDEEEKVEEKVISRRDFLKSASGVAAATALGTGMPLELGTAEATTNVELHFTCPIDDRTFSTFTDLKRHFASVHPAAAIPAATRLKVNGQAYDVQIEPHWTLQRTLQFKLGLTGAKTMCDRGECGSCAVIMDGKVVLSCTVLAVECEDKSIETIEGIAADPKWAPLIQSYMKWDAMQCGYCTPGFIITAKALLTQNPNPTEEEIKQVLAGNICRCSTYPRHPKAILEAAKVLKEGK